MSRNITMLFTPGLDSLMAVNAVKKSNLIQPGDKFSLVYFDLKHRYARYEISILLNDPYYYNNFKCDIYDGWDMSRLEKPNAHIPNRNLLLLTFAQSVLDSDVLLLNGVKDDRVSDNTDQFRQLAYGVLSQSAGKQVLITSPIADKEKAELIKEYHTQHGLQKTIEVAENTYSCYSDKYYVERDALYFIEAGRTWEEGGHMKLCGCMECHACFRRICAFAGTGIMIPFYDNSIISEYKHDTSISSELYPHRRDSIDKYFEFSNWVNG